MSEFHWIAWVTNFWQENAPQLFLLTLLVIMLIMLFQLFRRLFE